MVNNDELFLMKIIFITPFRFINIYDQLYSYFTLVLKLLSFL